MIWPDRIFHINLESTALNKAFPGFNNEFFWIEPGLFGKQISHPSDHYKGKDSELIQGKNSHTLTHSKHHTVRNILVFVFTLIRYISWAVGTFPVGSWKWIPDHKQNDAEFPVDEK